MADQRKFLEEVQLTDENAVRAPNGAEAVRRPVVDLSGGEEGAGRKGGGGDGRKSGLVRMQGQQLLGSLAVKNRTVYMYEDATCVWFHRARFKTSRHAGDMKDMNGPDRTFKIYKTSSNQPPPPRSETMLFALQFLPAAEERAKQATVVLRGLEKSEEGRERDEGKAEEVGSHASRLALF